MTWGNEGLYAIVLVVNEEYYGHIYTWKREEYPDTLFTMGIRARPDLPFLRREYEVELKVSNHLLEAVRLYADQQGLTRVVIPQPLSHMQGILRRLGFQRVTLNGLARCSNRLSNYYAYPVDSEPLVETLALRII